jgi:hypothetical protein
VSAAGQVHPGDVIEALIDLNECKGQALDRTFTSTLLRTHLVNGIHLDVVGLDDEPNSGGDPRRSHSAAGRANSKKY